jgi:hypothetical protein
MLRQLRHASRLLPTVLFVLALIPGCKNESDDETLACEAMCEDVGARCSWSPTTVDSCQTAMCLTVLSDTCVQTFQSAACEELSAEASPVADACFPPCASDSAVCLNDTITACHASDDAPTEFRTYVADCWTVCEYKDMTYSGVCGTTYQSQTSSTGQDVCWCQ